MHLNVVCCDKMPYYCTVPRCTSMAGKVKNVSFHQFPRDEQLAKLWNLVLKRGKPYTKYSKVCSLHFKREDYTITSVGKNKGQWRTLKKDAVPSQNLPLESPTAHPRRHSDPWPSVPPSLNIIDSVIQQQVAHAIYMQTMLAMQAASASNSIMDTASDELQHQEDQHYTQKENSSHIEHKEINSYKCSQCTKCFKDPDILLLHQRQHSQRALERLEKENFNINKTLMVQSNPILVNLLKNNDSNIKNNHLGDYNDIDSKMNQYLDVISKSNSLNSKINDNSEVEKVMSNDNIQKLETNNLKVTNRPISDEYTVNKSKISNDCDNKYFKNNRLNEDACENILPCTESRIHFYTDCVNNTKIDNDDRLLFHSKRDYNDSKTNFDTIKQPVESETSNITNERINRLSILANTNYSIINDDTQRDKLIFDNGKMIESLIDYKLNDKTYDSLMVASKISRSNISDSNLKDSIESNNFILNERVDFP